MDGKSQAWRDAAHSLLTALAKENKYIVSDMVILFLDSAGYGVDDYSPLGNVFKRAAKEGIIAKINQPKKSKQSLWVSKLYPIDLPNEMRVMSPLPELREGQVINIVGFGDHADGEYEIINMRGDVFTIGAKK